MGKLLISLPVKDCQRGTKSPQQIIQDSCNNTPSYSYIAAILLSFYYFSLFLYYSHIGTNQEKGKFLKKMGKLLLSLPGKDCQRGTKSPQQITQDSCNNNPSYFFIAALLYHFITPLFSCITGTLAQIKKRGNSSKKWGSSFSHCLAKPAKEAELGGTWRYQYQYLV